MHTKDPNKIVKQQKQMEKDKKKQKQMEKDKKILDKNKGIAKHKLKDPNIYVQKVYKEEKKAKAKKKGTGMWADYYRKKVEKEMEKKDKKNAKKEGKAEEKHVKKAIHAGEKEREKGFKKGYKESEKLLNKDREGLTSKQRSALQYEAHRNIEGDLHNQQRKLLGEQSQRGIVGKGGVGYAQMMDLNRESNELKGQTTRDLNKLSADMALKKTAASYAAGKGESAQRQLDSQKARDEINLKKDIRRARSYEQQFNRQYSR